MDLPQIKGFVETSFVDWHGQVAAVVFLPGCNFRCPYCHNHGLVLAPERFETWPLASVLERLEPLRGWVDGVCVTGGEPTLHAEIGAFLGAFRQAGWPVKLDTNGSRPEVLRELTGAGLTSAVSLDVKAPLEAVAYRRNAGAGADPEAVGESLDRLAASGLPIELRTTVHPDLLSEGELVRLAEDVGRRLRRGRTGSAPVRFTPQRCRVDDPLEAQLRDRPPLEPAVFDLWARTARSAFEHALGKARA